MCIFGGFYVHFQDFLMLIFGIFMVISRIFKCIPWILSEFSGAHHLNLSNLLSLFFFFTLGRCRKRKKTGRRKIGIRSGSRGGKKAKLYWEETRLQKNPRKRNIHEGRKANPELGSLGKSFPGKLFLLGMCRGKAGPQCEESGAAAPKKLFFLG